MSPARRWSLADFDPVLRGAGRTAAELATELRGRRPGDVTALRVALHATHAPTERDRLPLGRVEITEPMSRHLHQVRQQEALVCSVCGLAL